MPTQPAKSETATSQTDLASPPAQEANDGNLIWIAVIGALCVIAGGGIAWAVIRVKKKQNK